MPPSLNFAYLTSSYFHDTGIFGATSPILGQNFGLSVQQSLGNVTLTTLIADYRRYFMPVKPFTLAFRAMHMGRYGKNAEDERFYPLYIGYWDMLRGYESITSQELFIYENNPDQAFDFFQLYGSKMFMANVELRFPLLGVDLVKFVAEPMGGGGGGKPTLAQAGGKDATKLSEALSSVKGWVESKIE